MPESILVTGGTGFVGSNLVPVLSDAGCQVDVLAHNDSGTNEVPASVDIQSGDVTVPESLPSFKEYDTVVHLAGIVSVQGSVEDPVETFKKNSVGTQHVIERVRQDDVGNIVYLSSGAVYGNPDYLPIDEHHPTECLHPYASSKLGGEAIVEAYANSYKLSAVTLRGFTLYGPKQDAENLVPTVIAQLAEGCDSISLGNLKPTRDFTYIDDLTSAVLTVIEEHDKSFEIYNVGSGQETSVRRIVKEIISQSGQSATIESESTGRASDIEIERMVADISKLRQLGWEPEYDIRTGIKETLEPYNNV